MATTFKTYKTSDCIFTIEQIGERFAVLINGDFMFSENTLIDAESEVEMLLSDSYETLYEEFAEALFC